MLIILDLFRFPSQRKVTIFLCLTNFVATTIYYGPVLSIENIGFDIYVSAIVIQFSELIVYYPIYKFINRLPRLWSGLILFSIDGVCSCFLLFLEKPENCDFCGASIIELIIVFVTLLFFVYIWLNYIHRDREQWGMG